MQVASTESAVARRGVTHIMTYAAVTLGNGIAKRYTLQTTGGWRRNRGGGETPLPSVSENCRRKKKAPCGAFVVTT